MKNFIIGVFCSLFVSTAMAAEEIKIIWGFSIGSNQANTVRLMIEEANKSQNEFKFVLENKTGGGGSIAANHVLQNPSNSIVAMSSSFFIRPAFSSDGAHDLEKFQTVLVQAIGAPLGLVSGKFNNFEEFKSQKPTTVAFSGVGSISNIVADSVKKQNPEARIVPHKSMVDAVVAAAGGHVDSAITIIVDAKSFIDASKVKLIANTGGAISGSYQIPGTESLTANYGIFASKEMPVDKVKRIHSILSKVNFSESVLESYKKDMLTPVRFDFEKSQAWYQEEKKSWDKFVSLIK
jgi:tripartite-type tricarboxylate transporter receptor subunit TctC